MMDNRSCFSVGMIALFLITTLLPPTESVTSGDVVPLGFGKNYFPRGFYFGSGISAYQTEGAANKGGRFPSLWDTFTHDFPERIDDHSNGDVAVNLYEHYVEDIANMKRMGLNAFRFSISWSRVIPTGKIREGVNEQGIQFYNRLINETIKQGMEPFVTIFHWDVPQALEDKYGGFLCPSIIDDFRDFADLCFKKFGDRVKNWITVNEPSVFSTQAYDMGIHAPGRCSSWVNRVCLAGNSGTEPYIVAHHLILAHATAVQLYRQNYQETQQGKIGIALVSLWYEPYNEDSYADREAAGIALDFMFGWFMDPLTYGEYPRSMKVQVGNRLPKFLGRESKLVKGSYDFIGINYYTGYYASANFTPDPNPTHIRYLTDRNVYTAAYKDGIPIGTPTDANRIYVYPKGLRYLLNYTKDTYRNPTIYITENGIAEYNHKIIPLKESLNDLRTEYYKQHLWNVLGSINNYKVNVKGYFVWSFLDNFEWSNGYTLRFGLYFVDYENNLARHPKDAVHWFRRFLNHDILLDDPNLHGSLASSKINEDPTLNVVNIQP